MKPDARSYTRTVNLLWLKLPSNYLSTYVKSIALTIMFWLGLYFNSLAFKDFSGVSQLSIEQGLSQSTVNVVLQDSKGFIWVGTQDGLNRYDGYSFVAYEPNPHDSTSIAGNYIYTLYEDMSGVLWIGSNKGLSRYNAENNSFTNYIHRADDSTSLSGDRVYTIYEDKWGNLWAGVYNGGMCRIDKKSGTFKRYMHQADNPSSISSNKVTGIIEGKDGTAWVITYGGGINKFDPKTGKFSAIKFHENTENALSSDNIRSVYCDSEGNLWLGTREGVLEKFNPFTGKFIHYKASFTEEFATGANTINKVFKDNKGRLWVSFMMEGLMLFDIEKEAFVKDHPLLEDFSNQTGKCLSKSVYQDKNGIIWIGTEDRGVLKLDESKIKFKHYTIQNDKAHGKGNSFVSAMLKDSKGFLWVGIRGEGVYKLGLDNQVIKHYHEGEAHNFTLSEVNVWAIYEDRSGDIWVAYQSGVLSKLDKKTDKFVDYHLPEKIYSAGITCILEDSRNNFWVGTFGEGLFLFDEAKKIFKPKKFFDYSDDNLDLLKTSVIYEDSEGLIWVGTEGGGIFSFSPDKSGITTYALKQGKTNSLISNEVSSFAESVDGRLLIGTFGGLSIMDRQSGIFKNYTKKNGLPNNVIYDIVTDNSGNFWISSNKGISKVTLKAGKQPEFLNFDMSDGLQSNEFNHSAASKSSTGELYFGGIAGYNSFYPDSIKINHVAPPVVITSFKIADKEININRALALDDVIKLKHTDYVFSMEFAALGFTNSEKNRYAYKMEGFDEDWIYADTRRHATYTNLNPGNYTFRVKACNNDGVWNDEGASVSIYIKPPFWSTNIFYFCSAVAILLLFAAFVHLRTRRLTSKKEMLELTIKERTKEILEQKEEIEQQRDDIRKKNIQLIQARHIITQQYEELKDVNVALVEEVRDRTQALQNVNQDLILTSKELDELIYKASHDIRGPLARMIGLCNLAMLDITEPNAVEYLRILRKEAVNTTEILSKLLNIRHLKNNDITNNRTKIAALVRQCIGGFKNFENYHSINFDVQVPEDLQIDTDSRLLKIILINLLENAIVYANEQNPVVGVKASSSDQKLSIAVKDNGSGIPEEIVPRIFDRYFRGTEKSKGAGLGLYTASAAAEKLNGSVKLNYSRNSETEFVIELPLVLRQPVKQHSLT
jgi:ligand-binding sensor domain-containing protein/signal transduction histidine kinase